MQLRPRDPLLLAGALAWASPPHPVLVMADEPGIGDVKRYADDRRRTAAPTFAALARKGMLFEGAPAAAPVCVSARIGILTGRYARRFRNPAENGPRGFLSPQLPTDSFTVGRLRRRTGYRTGRVGKRRLGTLMPTPHGGNQGLDNVACSSPLETDPHDFGFDYSSILPGSLAMRPYVFVRKGEFQGEVTAQKGRSALNRIGPAAQGFEDCKALDAFATEAETCLERRASADHDEPFFLRFALTAPHIPTSPSPRSEGPSDPGPYGDLFEKTDFPMGQARQALERHSRTESTPVPATSGHGAAPCANHVRKAMPKLVREPEKLGLYASAIYRGCKVTVFEGGLRVPRAVRCFGVAAAGSRCERPAGLNDLTATSAEVAGGALAESEAPDSVSFLPLIRDGDAPAARRTPAMQAPPALALRHAPWKLAPAPGSGSRGLRGTFPVPAQAWRGALQAFVGKPTAADLRRAPFVQPSGLHWAVREGKNLATERADVVARLNGILGAAPERGRSTPDTSLRNARALAGLHRQARPRTKEPGPASRRGRPAFGPDPDSSVPQPTRQSSRAA